MLQVRVDIPLPHDTSDASGDRGRRVACVSSQGAQPGDVLLSETPFAVVLDPSLWATHCHTCFRNATDSATTLSRCGRCRTVYYCSRACQQRDWKPDHVVECPKLAQLTSLRLRSEQLSDVLLLGRVVRRLAAKPPAPTDDKVSPLHLAWHDTDSTQETELLAVLAQKLELVPGETTTTSTRHLQRLVSRFRSNNFSICDARLDPVGAGCFPLAAMVNHSCEPNAVITFDESSHRVTFRALRAIEMDEEITHSYEDTALPRQERQTRLSGRYHFTCSCTRCVLSVDDATSKDRFLDADINGIDQTKWHSTIQQQVDESAQLIAASAEQSSKDEAIGRLKKALAIQATVLHPNNIQRLATLAQLFSLQVEDERLFQDAISTGEQMLRVYEHVYASNHPIVGLHLFTLGDLCATQERHEEATKYLRLALAILCVTHGENHSFVMMIQQRLNEQ